MSRADSQLFVGIGSPFGDDQLGWIVADEIERYGHPNTHVRRGQSPADLFDWLDGHERLIVCDACYSAEQPGTWRRFDWPAVEIEDVEFAGTHDMNLAATLKLAEQLGMLPKQMTIWCMAVDCNSLAPIGTASSRSGNAPCIQLSPQVWRSIAPFVAEIMRDLQHA